METSSRPRSGEWWRTPEGRLIEVKSVQGDGVMGDATAPAITSGGTLTSSESVAHYDGRVQDFARYELVGPRWAVKFMAPAVGEHPTQDTVFAAINAVADVQHRETGSPIPGGVHQGAKYDAIVIGLTPDEAKTKLEAAVGDHGKLTILNAHRAL
jgi:hypothetical protein